jgi:glycosyltransferase involved in cell wall biosynthesis
MNQPSTLGGAAGRRGRECSSGKLQLSVVVPVHNEADNLLELAKRLQHVAHRLQGWEMQVLFVDDGSTDDSVQKMRDIKASGIPIGFLRLSRNYGHQAALCAGMENVSGDAVITMDADGQHPPEEIPRMIRAYELGYDVVQMARSERAGVSKGFFSEWFYKAFNRVSDTRIVPNAADFRLVSKPVLDVFLRIPEREKFIRGLIPALGFQQTVLEFKEEQRKGGMPSYSFFASLRLARKALFDYSTVPLKLVFWLGTAISIVSFTFGMGHMVWKLLHWDLVVPGFTDLITAIFFLSGCVLASLGILGRYTLMILEQVRARPAFVVMESVPGNTIPSSSPESFSGEQAAIDSDEHSALRKD